jgi:hypothetical protein
MGFGRLVHHIMRDIRHDNFHIKFYHWSLS